jgi:hypothetical protein
MDLIEKIAAPAAVALISWLIKDFIFGLYTRRNEVLRQEWEYRLKNIWSPLFYWSGIVLLDDVKKGWEKHGLIELERILAKSAHLIPRKHYYVFMTVVELLTVQKTTKKPTLQEITTAREYVYSQIELLNYLLYRSSGMDDVSVKTNVLHPYSYLLRMLSLGIIHLGVWLTIAGVIMGAYFFYIEGYYWLLAILILILAVVFFVDARKRREIRLDFEKRLKS